MRVCLYVYMRRMHVCTHACMSVCTCHACISVCTCSVCLSVCLPHLLREVCMYYVCMCVCLLVYFHICILFADLFFLYMFVCCVCACLCHTLHEEHMSRGVGAVGAPVACRHSPLFRTQVLYARRNASSPSKKLDWVTAEGGVAGGSFEIATLRCPDGCAFKASPCVCMCLFVCTSVRKRVLEYARIARACMYVCLNALMFKADHVLTHRGSRVAPPYPTTPKHGLPATATWVLFPGPPVRPRGLGAVLRGQPTPTAF